MRWSRTFSALAVVCVTVGCAPPGPRKAKELPSDFRHTLPSATGLTASLSYLQAGEARGTRLILVHGTPGSAQGWADYVLNPPSGMEVVALDRPGFGQSGPEHAVTRLAEQAAAVVALFPPDCRPAVLIGHSLGGAVVAQVAAEYPERVAAVVLLASSLDPAQEKIHPLQPLGATWPLRLLLPRALANANAELIAFKAELEALKPLLRRVTSPVVIVHGTQDDLVPFANVAYMQAELVNARCHKLMVLEGQNHFLPWNAEATVREAIAWAASTVTVPCDRAHP